MSIAVVTLLYSQDYVPGALTLGFQLQKEAKAQDHDLEYTTCIMVCKQLLENEDASMDVELLRSLYDQVIPVDSSLHVTETQLQLNRPNLELLDRPELAYTFLKLELWRLTQFAKIVYVDCDCLLIDSNSSDIKDDNNGNAFLKGILAATKDQRSHEIAASPDCGWPDLFNSGVFTLVPDQEVYDRLVRFVVATESIDGADQGLLNQFFNPVCHGGQDAAIAHWIRLPFVYNVTVPNAGYQNAPAAKYFRDETKLVHFIGKDKPWVTRGHDSEDDEFRDQWWRLYMQFLQSHPQTRDCEVETEPEDETGTPVVEEMFLPPQWDATKEPPPRDARPEAEMLKLELRFEWNLGPQLLEDELPKLQLGPKPVFPWETYTSKSLPQRVFPE
ncbi:LAME_0G05094g1_1 [Lachancea meyersii CBS 8951]|uniref:LAME_0G05094g1_1 n=1 Tax=Lachancea meyersii CBS 8951 TaxID=1266667 RepID=A0A1G4K763_9SACH|nr:LAME_0G05094g1_1 [Lachancea meyersii CBS 8951]